MKNVIVDLILECVSYVVLIMCVVKVVDVVENDNIEVVFVCIVIVIGKYWICKCIVIFINEV